MASESRLLEFSQDLRNANITVPLGFLQIHYSGRNMELGSQLTLYPIAGKGGLDSPRSLKGDFVSTGRHAVTWMPLGGTVVLAFTNFSYNPVNTSVVISGRRESISIGPLETIVKRVEAPIDGPALTGSLLDVDLSYSGPTDAIRLFGYVSSPSAGSFPLRVYDLSGSTMATLSAVGLSTNHVSHVTVKNVSSQPVLVKPSLVQVGSQTPLRLPLPPILVAAQSSTSVPVQPVLTEFALQGIPRATLLLANDAPVGTLLGSVTQQTDVGALEDIPFRTGNPPGFMRGAYPLRWQGDYTNRPMVANTSDQSQKVRAYVIAGGSTYVFPVTTVLPGTTVDFDVDRLRSDHIPDVNGSFIPQSATFGKFHWAPEIGKIVVGLHGRTELASAANLRASSFSCGIACAYESQALPFFDQDPFGFFPSPFTTGARESNGHAEVYDAYGNFYTYGVSYSQYAPVSVATTSILSNTPINSDATVRSDTGSPGDTSVSYYFLVNQGQQSEDGSFCEYQDYGYQRSEPVAVQIPTNTRVVQSIVNAANSCPSMYAGWNRTVIRGVIDQNGRDIAQSGQSLAESVTLVSNDLSIGGFNTSPAVTDPQGQFIDQFSFCSAACPASAATSVANQQITDTYNGTFSLAPTTIEFACGNVKVNGRLTP